MLKIYNVVFVVQLWWHVNDRDEKNKIKPDMNVQRHK